MTHYLNFSGDVSSFDRKQLICGSKLCSCAGTSMCNICTVLSQQRTRHTRVKRKDPLNFGHVYFMIFYYFFYIKYRQIDNHEELIFAIDEFLSIKLKPKTERK